MTIDFNEKDGINPNDEDEDPYESTTFLPKCFSRNSSSYELKLDFDGDWSGATTLTVTLTSASDVAYVFNLSL